MDIKSKNHQRYTGKTQREALSATINKKQQMNHSKPKKNKSKMQDHRHAQSPNPISIPT